MSEVSIFYNYSHGLISFISGILLLAIWYNIRRRFIRILEENESEKRVDKGLLFLSFSLFVWALLACWTIWAPLADTVGHTLGTHLLSVLNTAFILYALSYFDYAPKFIYHNERNVLILTGIAFFIAISTLVLAQFDQADSWLRISGVPDFILSGFLSFLLMISLYRTFINRGLVVMALLSVMVIALVFLSQLPEVITVFNDGFVNNIIKLVSKVSLIILFMVLATTWVIRLANRPKPNEVSLSFLDWSLIKINIPSKQIHHQVIDFEAKTTQYKNLLKFAIRRKYGSGTTQCIQIGYGGELNNQTYLTRIINNINGILQLDDLQKLERRDLFTFIGDGNYRLRIAIENISFEPTLLEEAAKTLEPEIYADLIRYQSSNPNTL